MSNENSAANVIRKAKNLVSPKISKPEPALPPLEPIFTDDAASTAVLLYRISNGDLVFYRSSSAFEVFRNKFLRGKFSKLGSHIVQFHAVRGVESDIVVMQAARFVFPTDDHTQIAFCKRDGKYFTTWNIQKIMRDDAADYEFIKIVDAYPADYFPAGFIADHPKTSYKAIDFDKKLFVNVKDPLCHIFENEYSSGIIFLTAKGYIFFRSKMTFAAYIAENYSEIVPTRNGFVLRYGDVGMCFPAPPLPKFTAFFDKLTIYEINDGSLRVAWGDCSRTYDNCANRVVIPAYTVSYTPEMFLAEHPAAKVGVEAFVAISKGSIKIYGWGNNGRKPTQGSKDFDFTYRARATEYENVLSVTGIVELAIRAAKAPEAEVVPEVATIETPVTKAEVVPEDAPVVESPKFMTETAARKARKAANKAAREAASKAVEDAPKAVEDAPTAV